MDVPVPRCGLGREGICLNLWQGTPRSLFVLVFSIHIESIEFYSASRQHLSRFLMHRTSTSLVARENQRISNHHILFSASNKHNDFGNILRRKRIASPELTN